MIKLISEYKQALLCSGLDIKPFQDKINEVNGQVTIHRVGKCRAIQWVISAWEPYRCNISGAFWLAAFTSKKAAKLFIEKSGWRERKWEYYVSGSDGKRPL